MKVKLFTTAFRKIREDDWVGLTSGEYRLVLPLRDQTGAPLSNGVYYVVVETARERAVQRLMILR